MGEGQGGEAMAKCPPLPLHGLSFLLRGLLPPASWMPSCGIFLWGGLDQSHHFLESKQQSQSLRGLLQSVEDYRHLACLSRPSIH